MTQGVGQILVMLMPQPISKDRQERRWHEGAEPPNGLLSLLFLLIILLFGVKIP